jgi:hypothetical protein
MRVIRNDAAQHTPVASPTAITTVWPQNPECECSAAPWAAPIGAANEISVRTSTRVRPTAVWRCSPISDFQSRERKTTIYLALLSAIVEIRWYEKAGLLYLLCLEHVDNLGAYSASRPETGLLIPSGNNSGLLELRVLGFGLFQDGDVGVGVFPEGEKVFVSCEGFRSVILQDIGTS